MTRLLYINASPRGGAAACSQAGDLFLHALPDSVDVTTLRLFDMSLPEVTENVVNAKFKFAAGADLTDAEAAEWATIEALVDQFISADTFLFGVPMWNFSIPYRMKQYIDLITHPGLTFASDEKGIRGLASGAATVIYSRGGNYSPKDGQPDPYDFQSPYFKAWLGLVGLGPVSEVLVQGTAGGPDAQAAAVEGARKQLESLAKATG
jgi:FMN-dependent NADH-azoreductase